MRTMLSPPRMQTSPLPPIPQAEPIVSLPQQEIKTLEDGKEELFKVRAKLLRLAAENDVPEWKEWGTDIKLLKPEEKGTIRFLVRRAKILKVCANHYITSVMELRPNAGSDLHLGLQHSRRLCPRAPQAGAVGHLLPQSSKCTAIPAV